jgi:hypothetical protein
LVVEIVIVRAAFVGGLECLFDGLLELFTLVDFD